MAMTEQIPVFVKIQKGITVCICHGEKKRCGDRNCEREWVVRDKCRQWEATMKRSRFGK